jgi:uncharacterized protein YecE (DUF72 family)
MARSVQLSGRATRPQFRIGCSGWNYKAWRGLFYPPDLQPADWLGFYATRFNTVEANSTFYRLPPPAVFSAWQREVPRGFLMAVKASGYLTHFKRLREPEEPLQRFFDHAAALGERLGPVLYQLPGRFQKDMTRLRTFLELLPVRLDLGGLRPRSVQHVVEFRHPSWYDEDVYGMLRSHRVALCLHDKRGSPIQEGPADPFVYMRFHGTSGHYSGSYGDQILEQRARFLVRHWRRGRDVYAYFNNDPAAVAVENATRLRAMTQRLGAP